MDRGGSFDNAASNARSANRNKNLGLRPAKASGRPIAEDRLLRVEHVEAQIRFPCRAQVARGRIRGAPLGWKRRLEGPHVAPRIASPALPRYGLPGVTIYLDLTREFNAGSLRAVICSGPAAVLHRLAIASKDGDWILREDPAALGHVLGVLARHGARYRFGAPLDARWMSGGWSAHLEFREAGLRVRTDFFTRPPRVSPTELERMWTEQEGQDPPFTDARMLAEMKKTDREKDYPFLGELARRMTEPRDRFLYSRSADDLIELARRYPELALELVAARPLLARIAGGRRQLLEAIQLEMLDLMEQNEVRLSKYSAASAAWAELWPALAREIEGLELTAAHACLIQRAEYVLPREVSA